jgi:hypothetical protein
MKLKSKGISGGTCITQWTRNAKISNEKDILGALGMDERV